MLYSSKKGKTLLKIKRFLSNPRGNSIPMVMLVALILVILGGAITNSVLQMFKISRGDQFEFLAYVASESAIERSICNVDSCIQDIADDIEYMDKDSFVDSIITEMNNPLNSYVLPGFSVDVLPTNTAEATLSFSEGPVAPIKDGNEITFQVVFDAVSKLESDIYKFYGKRVVAKEEFTVTIPDSFQLNGAVYSIGDVFARGSRAVQSTEIFGDVYAFGTGLNKSNSMKQHYNGGICSIEDAEMRIRGNAFSNGLVRAGMFDEIEGDPNRSSIIVHNDIVSQGVQVFGNNDYIVCDRDVYTFDDVELNGPNSYIGIRGNYFGLSKGDGYWHDASSAILNMSPLYSDTEGYRKSRIIVNGSAYINGEVFKIADDGKADHKLENAAMAWDGDNPLQDTISFTVSENTPETRTQRYQQEYKTSINPLNGFSILIQAQGWDNPGDPKAWMEAAIAKLGTSSNPMTNSSIGLTFPTKIGGYCKFAMSANDRVYISDPLDAPTSQIEKPAQPDGDNLKYAGVNNEFWTKFFIKSWNEYNDSFSAYGMERALSNLHTTLQNHISVFARKVMSSNASDPEMVYESDSLGFQELFGNVKELFNKQNVDKRRYFLYYPNDAVAEVIDISAYINSSSPSDPYNPNIAFADGNPLDPADLPDGLNDNYFVVINDNPDRTIYVNQEINAIIITKGQVKINTNGKVNGSIIAAGKGYDASGALIGSSADGSNRLPRVDVDDNVSINNFKNLGYAGVIFQNGGSVIFPGRDALLNKFYIQGIDLTKVF